MPDINDNIKRIHQKLQLLSKRYQSLVKENEVLQQQLTEVSAQNEKNKQRIYELQEQVGILKSVTSQMSPADKKAFEKHISHYIREIDKCIGILSE